MKRVNLVNLTMRELSLIIISQMHAGKTIDDMVLYLRGRGWPEDAARRFVANTLAGGARPFPNAGIPKGTSSPRGLSAQLMLWVVAIGAVALLALVIMQRLPS